MPDTVSLDLVDEAAVHALLRTELACVVADPGFNRSPALSRLLSYLVEQTIAGQADRLKSYTVAVEGLGRSADYDAQVNTYARVLVARLRRRLESFYREEGADRVWRLEIPQGSYEVTLVANLPRPGPRAGEQREPGSAKRPARFRLWQLAWAALAASAAIAGWLIFSAQPPAEVWRTDNFPVVLIEPRVAGTPDQGRRLQEFGDALGTALSQYEIVHLANRTGQEVTHKLRLELIEQPGGPALRAVLVDIGSNRELIVNAVDLRGLPAGSAAESAAASDLAFRSFGFSGVLTTAERTASRGPNTPYDCWLRFSAALLIDGGVGDQQLHECVSRWHDAAPQHPLAASLYGWVLANEAIASPLAIQRQWKLQEAIRTLEEARVTNPNSRHVLAALARVQAQAGNVSAVRDLVAQLVDRKLLNPDFKSVVGTLMLLANDPAGEKLVDEAITSHPLTPPPRYYLGKFVAAMMRDDVASAQAAAAKITAGDETSNWSNLVRAAIYARTGQQDEARRYWSRLQAAQPLLVFKDDFIIDRLPAAEPVKQRMRQWLQPILQD